ncbi:MAG TPA: hypothetical protein VMI75_17220 [Polyangiaceae bacterium]|nr:hypothetical protein [Polyangiaceae bacterium]
MSAPTRTERVLREMAARCGVAYDAYGSLAELAQAIAARQALRDSIRLLAARRVRP